MVDELAGKGENRSMMVHLGEDCMQAADDILLMLDLSHGPLPDTEAFLGAAREAGRIRRVSQDPPKTAVLIRAKGETLVYLSPISSSTLLRRAGVFE